MVEAFVALLSYLEAIMSPENGIGLAALFAVAVITDIGFPVPFVLETVLLLTAYNSGALSMHVLLVIIVLFLGRQAGSAILYFVSRHAGSALLNWFNRHFPTFSRRLGTRGIDLTRWAPLTIATSRMTPGLLQVTSIAAGAIRLRYYDFVLGITFASIIYDGVIILLGFITSSGPQARDTEFTIWLMISIFIVLFFLWPLCYMLIRRNNKHGNNRSAAQ